MVKQIASIVAVCSLAAGFACSSSSGNPGGFGGGDDGGDAATQSVEDSGGQGNSGSSSGSTGDSATASCSNPVGQIATLTGKSVPAACETCVNGMCASSVAACSSSSCATCGVAVYECAMSSCSSSCFPVADSGTTKPHDAGTTSDAGDPCATLMSCGGCTLVNATMPGSMATCMQAITGDQTAVCQGYLSGIHAVSPTTCN
jgi:hypothetical protein